MVHAVSVHDCVYVVLVNREGYEKAQGGQNEGISFALQRGDKGHATMAACILCMCMPESATLLAQFLASTFPSLRSVSFFFHFAASPPKPSLSLTSMMRRLVADLSSRAVVPLQTSVSVLWSWGCDFDNLDNVDQMSRPGWREALLQIYGCEGENDLVNVCVT